MKLGKLAITLLVLFLALIPSIHVTRLIWDELSKYVFPPGNDPGNWLKHANALRGITYPMWEETLFQYPPLFFALLALVINILGEELLALKLMLLLSFFLRPIACCLLAWELTGNPFAGIIAAVLTAYVPIYYEMLAWGGYPNLFGFVLLPLSFWALVRLVHIPRVSKLDLCLAILLNVLTISEHHLTSLVFLSVSSAWLLLISSFRIRNHKHVLKVYLADVAAFFLLRLAAGEFQYVVKNPYARMLAIPLSRLTHELMWIFKEPLLITLLAISSTIGAYGLISRRRFPELSLLVLWFILPFLFTQLHVLGIYLDSIRFAIFSVMPLTMLASSVPLPWFERWRGKAFTLDIRGVHVLCIALVGVLAFQFVRTGTDTFYAAAAYYRAFGSFRTYGDTERLEALEWIKANTSERALFFADIEMGRWIEGYAHRRVVLGIEPQYAFMKGELWRLEMYKTMLKYDYELRNDYIKLVGLDPCRISPAPLFMVSVGDDFRGLLYVDDSYSRVIFRSYGSILCESPFRATLLSHQSGVRGDTAYIKLAYETSWLMINKTMWLRKGEPYAELHYMVLPKNGEILFFNFSLWLYWDARIEDYNIGRNSVDLRISGIDMIVEFTGNVMKLEVGPDPEWHHTRVHAVLASRGDFLNVTISLRVLNAKPYRVEEGLKLFTVEGLSKECGDVYVVLPSTYDDALKRFETHSNFSLVFKNDKILIFRYRPLMASNP